MNKQQLKRIIKEELTKMLFEASDSEEQRRSGVLDVDGEKYTVLYSTYADEDGTLRDSPGFQTILDPSGKPIMRRLQYDRYAPIDYMTLDGEIIHSADGTFSGADFGLADAVRAMKG